MNIHSLSKTCPQSRLLLVERIQLQQWTVCEAAEAAGISRRTMYKWLARTGPKGFQDFWIAVVCQNSPDRNPRGY